MSAIPAYRFGMSEFTTHPWTFEQDIEHYAQLGVDTVEVCEIKLDPQRITEQLASIPAHHLVISSVQPQTRTLFPSVSQPEPLDPAARMERFKQTIDAFGDAARGVPFVTNTGIAPNGNIQHLLDVAVEHYRDVAEHAAQHGARVAFEPLNPVAMHIESAIWTIQQAMRLVEQVNHPAFGLCIDSWNIWQNPERDAAIRACGDRIFVVQLSDWRTPRSANDRISVGHGEIPFVPILQAIHASGFAGAYSVEIFSEDAPDAVWNDDLAQVITENRKQFERLWHEAFTNAS